jgi:hypothetical protein
MERTRLVWVDTQGGFEVWWLHIKRGLLMPEYSVDFLWDAEAAVWVATSDDIRGLVLESGSLDVLIERVRHAAPEMLALNGAVQGDFSLCLRSERRELMSA